MGSTDLTVTGATRIEVKPSKTRWHDESKHHFTTQRVVIYSDEGQQVEITIHLESGCHALAVGNIINNDLPAPEPTKPTVVIIYGPEGCGKTLHARALADYYGMAHVFDNWTLGKHIPDNTLALTNANLSGLPGAIRFADAMQAAGLQSAEENSLCHAIHLTDEQAEAQLRKAKQFYGVTDTSATDSASDRTPAPAASGSASSSDQTEG